MLGYIIRRTLYMIPTVFGVIVITFVLFNIAGGDPAKMRLGKQATARDLEQYDKERGYDKPLLAGSWGKTRAWEDASFEMNAGRWSQRAGVVHTNAPGETGRIVLAWRGEYEAPLAFALSAEAAYKWSVVYRLSAPAEGGGEGAASFAVAGSGGTVAWADFRPGRRFNTATLVFPAGAEPAGLRHVLRVDSGALEIRSMKLRRRTAHFLDSQFFFYLRQLARLDFGKSHETNQRISTMMLGGILPSLALTLPMFLVSLTVSIALALACAFYRDSIVDKFFVVLSVVLMSVNYLVWIVAGQFLLGHVLKVFPVWGFESARYLALPCLIGVISGLGSELRFYRTIMLDEMYRDYVRTAFAKGVSERGVLFRHVLKNAMIPILTGVIMQIPFLYTGSLLLESFFGIPGLGRMGVDALNSSDADVIKALVLVGAVIYVVANLITDVCYALVDPRVKLK